MKNLLKYLFLYFPAILNAQEVTFQYEFGYGSYQLEDIRAIQNRVGIAYSQSTESFPNHYIQSVAIGYITGQHHFGASGGFLTTGGRVHVADYSGEYKTDMVLTGVRVGVFYRYYFPKNTQWWNMYIQAAPGYLSSRIKMHETLVIGTRKIVDERLSFKSSGAYFEPSIGVRLKPLHWLHLSLGCGYEIDAWGKMKLLSTRNNMQYRGDDKIRWNGFRLYAGLILTVPSQFFKESDVKTVPSSIQW